MGQALYRKYRSKSLDDVVGQEHITTTLKNALKQGTVSHAYLFTGPRGVGKTSVARILAHAVNDLPYTDEVTHLDIIEIDAASNRRIDEIRELRERVHTAPASAPYKVYIIDEVHMLTKEAFNALLKTLEEPPAHVIFILATTEVHKLPDTIISRTQRFTFKPIESADAIDHLQNIAKSEKIDITPDALALISRHGGGSFRDSISMLDQVSSTGSKIDLSDVQAMLGIAPDTLIQETVQALSAQDSNGLLRVLGQLRDQGYSASHTAKQLAEQLRSSLVNGNSSLERKFLTDILRQLIDVPASHDPESLLEIILLSAALPSGASMAPTQVHAPPASPKLPQSPTPKQQDAPKPTAESAQETVRSEAAEKTTGHKKSADKGQIDEESWQQALEALKQRYSTLYSIARMANPRFSGTELILEFSFPFHQKRLNEAKNRQIIADIVADVTGSSITVTCELNPHHKGSAAAKPEMKTASSPPTDAISNIFGGIEVLES